MNMTGTKWTPEELRVMVEQFANTRTDEIAAKLGRTYRQVAMKAWCLGLRKSAEYLVGPDAHRFDGKKGAGTRFQAGLTPWNKGKSGTTGLHENCRATQYGPGNMPHTWKPVGTERIDDGILMRKVSDTRVKKVDWQPVHVLVWSAANGPVPEGHVVIFRPGCKTAIAEEITADRLECVSRADLMRRNSFLRFGQDIAKAIQLRGAITRQINQRAKHEQQDHQ